MAGKGVIGLLEPPDRILDYNPVKIVKFIRKKEAFLNR